jgi:hypothetical protein
MTIRKVSIEIPAYMGFALKVPAEMRRPIVATR